MHKIKHFQLPRQPVFCKRMLNSANSLTTPCRQNQIKMKRETNYFTCVAFQEKQEAKRRQTDEANTILIFPYDDCSK